LVVNLGIQRMTIKELLDLAVSQHLSPIIGQEPASRLDARLILCHLLGISMEKLLAELNSHIDPSLQDPFFQLWEQRISGTPISYITGVKEFFGRDFYVDSRVLIPRPDTEILVETVLNHHGGKPNLSIHDCCTGSGCIAITLALEQPTWNVTSSDISHDAIEVATKNASQHNVTRIRIFLDDLITNLDYAPDIITANPPYLTDNEAGERISAGWKEPEIALKSGTEGLEHIKKLVYQASKLLKPGGFLYIEASSNQAPYVRKLLTDHNFNQVDSVHDLNGFERVTYGHL
jgi:release factor glutamine methyltransferase